MPPEVMLYGWFAEAYHWTPEQVRELELDELTWLPIRHQGIAEAQRVEREREERMSRSSSVRRGR